MNHKKVKSNNKKDHYKYIKVEIKDEIRLLTGILLGADNWKIDPTSKEIMETIKSLPKDETTILDLECGDGHDCLTIAKAGYKTIGVDFVPLAIRKAKKTAEKAGVREQTSFTEEM